MRNIFREYHQFSESEFKELWKNCLFVFDTNTLLNMYRYSRETVEAYFNVLNELKNKKQLWIPYQVGYEFYENRINVIFDYEKSYDEILNILEKAKNEIEAKYKDHPFLNLLEIKEEMNKGLSGVESKIKQAKSAHPKWLEKDDVLENLNQLFKGYIGNNYNTQRLNDIKKEGKERYERKIPPGFKDDKKSEDKKYGDLIIWFQIIDKARECKKPIVLISGDIKEDWWLEKDGKKLMPLPQLKKELYDKAGVGFHIYTADRFLELNKTDVKKINDSAIKEVRKIRELEEKRMMMQRMEMMGGEGELDAIKLENYLAEFICMFESLENLMQMNKLEIPPIHREELYFHLQKVKVLRNKFVHGEIDKNSFVIFYASTKEILFIIYKIINSEKIHPEIAMRFKECVIRLEQLNHRFRKYM
ncbi:MAG: hypothetical protein A2Y10_12230 [Planctomycetes bacterium GWF2_41_51]|nr:MAG: hypothetical protein A2Y10_12230 [Planctomycetes bacterium GWF2_41_51]HBG28713.1 hypothetical protein [Phycisphaerales bacterium]